jgi:hypothetical protein
MYRDFHERIVTISMSNKLQRVFFRRKDKPRKLKSYWIPIIERAEKPNRTETAFDNHGMSDPQSQSPWDGVPRKEDNSVASNRVAYGGVGHIGYGGREELYTPVDFSKKKRGRDYQHY